MKGAFFALSVPNLEESARWYGDKFELDVVQQVDQDTSVTVLEGEGLTVGLIHDPAARPASGQPGSVHGFFKAGFGPFPAKDGQGANAILRDNVGNMIQVFGN